MNLSDHFTLKEFVPREIWNVYGDNSIWFISPLIVNICEVMRVKIDKPIKVNDWFMGGTYNYSGYRPPECTVGATKSQHRFGRAADIKVEGMTPDEVRQWIRINFQLLHPLGLTTIEKDTPTWTHIDTRWTLLDHLLEVPYQ